MITKEITSRQIEEAVSVLRAGGLVSLPSETVYGLGARADDEDAVARIFLAKGRPHFNPLIAHMASLEMAENYAEFPSVAKKLAREFWPGPLTMVLNAKPSNIAKNVSAGLETLAIRVPAHPVFHEIIKALGTPVAAPSANSSGQLSPTCARHVEDDLGVKLDYMLDGGACALGLESTILMINANQITLSRHGAIEKEAIEEFLGQKITEVTTSDKPAAPGQLLRHYAPKTPLLLEASPADLTENDIWIGFGDGSAFDISPKSSLDEAAHNLFAFLARADQMVKTGGRLLVAPIPNSGIGRAINDRLTRAAAAVIGSDEPLSAKAMERI